MRIQHNIMAMNSYRNLGLNQSGLAKNLEKLSSGYRINRAGDDAAGLAISEKMRAQITGLDAAQKNVKDGISLVKTAEGAMQEIHDMLGRMKYLATQSANGTYGDEVDRANLQKEVESLRSEIDRIADAADFNGQKLLNGDLESTKGSDKVKIASATVFTTMSGGTTFSHDFTVTSTATKGDELKLNIKYQDKTGNVNQVEFRGVASGTAAADIVKDLEDQIKSHFGDNYKVTINGATVKIENTKVEQDDSKFLDISLTVGEKKPAVIAGANYREGKADVATIDLSKVDITDKNANNRTLEIDGKRFEIQTKGKKVSDGAIGIYVDQSTGTLTADSVKQIVAQLRGNGVNVKVNDNANTSIDLNKGDGGKGLDLQIGDTADGYNKLQVSVGDMHSTALGLASLNIGSQLGAQAAVKMIENAINRVSFVRGDLGAIQNRLEHTSNNLGVMKENIQDAESTIRDTDVADEMMRYTKNNILMQSSQAMLAQANQVPQGVLQLLQ